MTAGAASPSSPLAAVVPHRKPPAPGTRGSRIAALPGLGSRGTGNRDGDQCNPNDGPPRDLPDFLDAVDAVLDTRETGESPRITVSSCPTYLIVEWQTAQTLTRCDIGAGLTALILRGLTNLNDLPGVRRFDDIATSIRDPRSSPRIPMRDRVHLFKTIGTTKRPGVVIRPSVPCGEVETLQFRIFRHHHAIILNRAEQLGMYVSTLAILGLGSGLTDLSNVLDPETAATVAADMAELDAKFTAQAERLERLTELYRTKPTTVPKNLND